MKNKKKRRIPVKWILYALAAVCLTCLAAVAAGLGLKWSAEQTAVITVIAAVVAVLWTVLILYPITKRERQGVRGSLFEAAAASLLVNMRSPVLFTDAAGTVIWCNGESVRSLSAAAGMDAGELLGERFSALRSASKNNPGGVRVTSGGRTYLLRVYDTGPESGEARHCAVLEDISDTQALELELEDREAVVAYVVIDNLGEGSQEIRENASKISAEITELLQNWAQEKGGAIREYERGRYWGIFDKRSLKSMVDAKFEILDRVRAVHLDEFDVPVTISAGFSNIRGTLAEKEGIARQALAFALERGGDQVVVKDEISTELYGGRTKTVQRKTKVRSRVIGNELIQLINKCGIVIIMGHKHADNDSIGACVGIARLVMSLGKDARIVVNVNDMNLKSAFNRLRGLPEYINVFTDAAGAMDELTSNSLLVVVDVNNPEHFESPEVFANARHVAIIDHHRRTVEYDTQPDVTYIEPSSSSTCELVAEMLESALEPGRLLREEAELLLAGIILDTKQFVRNTGSRTFAAALYLRSEGASPDEALNLFRISSIDMAREARFISALTIHRGTVAISAPGDESGEEDRMAASKAADRMLSIDDVAAAFTIYRIKDVVNISGRSNGSVNVQLILEVFGGGGHFDMAGAQVRGDSVRGVVARLIKEVDAYLDGME